ncbi:MAG: sulfate ABC transporter substrate-binding protein [Chloroflexi bacterium]|nr:sulfate ABC transporter substrate-binding protein [Chloroflexota bacterium]
MRTHKRVQLFTAALIVMVIAGGCQPVEQPTTAPVQQTIIVHGFSIEEEVITEEIFPAFQAYWLEQAGQEVTFQSAFAGSEDLTEAIIDGAKADVAILSNEQHAVWLQVNDLVETDWHTFPNEGIVSRSPIVVVVRPGNPLGIKDWIDLARPGVRLVHPDPRTSGGAQWAILAEYGSALLGEGGSTQAAQEQLAGIWDNVAVTPVSSREALKQFLFGTGDALVTYEQDALLARDRGAALEIVVPRSTVMSEHVVVIVDENVKPWEREVVEAFVTFLWSERAQTAFTRYYFRAVTDDALNEAVPEFGENEIRRSFTAQDLGGWGLAYPEIIRGVWEKLASE